MPALGCDVCCLTLKIGLVIYKSKIFFSVVTQTLKLPDNEIEYLASLIKGKSINGFCSSKKLQ